SETNASFSFSPIGSVFRRISAIFIFQCNNLSMHPDSHHHNHSDSGGQGILLTVLALTAAFATVEAAAGWISGSLALLGDAGHMLTDTVALGIGTFAAWLSRKPPSERHSYGLQRAEALGALLNVTFMLAI